MSLSWSWRERVRTRQLPLSRLLRVPKELVQAWLELFVLTGFAVAQPILDVTGKAPDFFLFRRASRLDMLLLVLAVTLLPALLLGLVEAAAWLAGERARELVHLGLVAGLFALIALEALKKLVPMRGKRLALLALLLAAGFALLYHKRDWVRLWLRYLAPAPLVFALLFATTSPSAELLRPVRTAAVAPVRTASTKALPPIVMVFFDEFPLQSLLDSSGRIDRRVYPNFADFAAHSTWYRNATGVSGFTPYAVPAMLTGRYPSKVVAPILQNFPENLFTLFGSWYNLKVSETITQLCPPVRCGVTAGSRDASGLGAVLRDSAGLYKSIVSPYDTPVNPASFADTQTAAAEAGGKGSKGRKKLDTKDPAALFKNNITNAELNAPSRFTDFLDSIKAGDPQPSLYFLHILLPHTPWRFEPDGALYNQGSLPFMLSLPEEQWPRQYVELTHQRHLLQLAYTDKLVGDLIQRLKDQGLYDKALVLLTADHGNGFVTGERARRLGATNAPSLMWVPLLVKAPNQSAGKVDDRNWEQVDLLPTLADMVGIRVPWKMDGLSQVGPPARTRDDKDWYDHPGDRETRDGPSNWATVRKGVTDSLVQAHQHGDQGFYQYGWFADWVYKPPSAIGRITAGPTAKATIRNWKLFETIDPKAATVPALVVGQLTTPSPPPGTTVLVAVNGQVGGASLFYSDHAGQPANKFAVIAPDFLYKKGPGHPQLQIYLVKPPSGPGSKQLQPVALSG